MPNTQIFVANLRGWVHPYADIANHLEGGFHIWQVMSNVYLGHDITHIDQTKEVFELVYAADRVPYSQRLALGATLDKVVVFKDNLSTYINALISFTALYPTGNLRAQIRSLEAVERSPDVLGVCWNQTSQIKNAWRLSKNGNKMQKWNLLRDLNYVDLFKEVRLDGAKPKKETEES